MVERRDYYPLLALKEILTVFDIDVDSLKLSDSLLKCTFVDCYAEKSISENKIKIEE